MNRLCVTIKTISNLFKLTFLGPANNNDLILKTSHHFNIKQYMLLAKAIRHTKLNCQQFKNRFRQIQITIKISDGFQSIFD